MINKTVLFSVVDSENDSEFYGKFTVRFDAKRCEQYIDCEGRRLYRIDNSVVFADSEFFTATAISEVI